MSSHYVYAMGGVVLFALGTYALLARPHLIHKVIAANFMGSGVFLVLIGLGNRTAAEPDPVPQAMVLTGIVVTVAMTALGLAIVKRYYSATGMTTLDAPGEDGERR
ncbi:MAG TPA: NADH-quinone oxidoreductase subunit K [Coriobacteriia bacterium]|nr:NADH-quinone oxidoreductase subunit K [Coriobacteriia bacterium]